MLALVLAPLLSATAPACAAPPTVQAAQHAPLRARKLGELPDAEMDLAVIRSIGGCWVRQVVRFNVSDPNPPAQSPPGVRAPGYTGTLVPDGSIPKTAPAGR